MNFTSFTVFHRIIILQTNSVFILNFVYFYNFVDKEYHCDIQYRTFILLTIIYINNQYNKYYNIEI
jgi:hypothetical protein